MVPRVRRSQTWTSRGSGGGSQTRATLVGGEYNRRYGIPAPLNLVLRPEHSYRRSADRWLDLRFCKRQSSTAVALKLRQHCERRLHPEIVFAVRYMSGTDDRISTSTVQQSSASLNLHFLFHFHLLLSLLLTCLTVTITKLQGFQLALSCVWLHMS